MYSEGFLQIDLICDPLRVTVHQAHIDKWSNASWVNKSYRNRSPVPLDMNV
jgi:hypothetical protein